jgi:Ca2+-binding RTX toxin-like protein
MWPISFSRSRRFLLAAGVAGGLAVLLVGAEVVLGAPAVAAGPSAPGTPAPPAFLTHAAAGKPVAIALGYLHRERESLGLAAGDLKDIVVSDVVVDRDTGTTHVYLRQRVEGIEVAGGVINVSVARDGSVITLGNRFVPRLGSRISPSGPLRSAEQGVKAGARAVGLTPRRALRRQRASRGAARETVFAGAGISARPIPVELVYVKGAQGALRLAWNVTLLEPAAAHYWNVSTDASTGELIAKTDHLEHATPSYNVFALPVEGPSFGARSIVTSTADPLASPFGWHDDPDGSGPASATLTFGNNVHAGTDLDNNFRPDVDNAPDGGPALAFDFPFDPNFVLETGGEFAQFWPAAVTNLFHTVNVLHDVFYRHGFDEDAGNLQMNNYGRGGLGGDPMWAMAQSNVANFTLGGALEDGIPGLMLLTGFGPPTATLRVTSPAPADYELPTDEIFHRPLTVAGVTGAVELVNDGVEPTGDACQPLVGFTAGSIALIRWAGCGHLSFAVQHAEQAGASAVLVVNPPPHGLFAGTVPVRQMTTAQGDALQASLPATATLFRSGPERHSAFDNGMIAHEYGHAVGYRLGGGPSETTCFTNEQAPNEGWADFFALVMTARGATSMDRNRGFATYSLGHAPDGPGWRGAPYSPDLSVNPWTYGNIRLIPAVESRPHFIGSRWGAMLWEVYWNLVEEHGFNPNLHQDWTTGGNNLALRLVLDGLKLAPCFPGFVDARNAMLLADQNLTGGENQCRLWRGFAKRGLGQNANQGGPFDSNVTEDFTVPVVACAPVADAYTVDEDAKLIVARPGVLGNDIHPDGHELTARVVAEPAHGTLQLRPDGLFTYNSDPDYNGPDSFTYKVSDGSGVDSNSASVSLTVNAVNDAPVLDAAASPSLSPLLEDSGAPVGAVGTLVSELVDFAVPAGGLDNVGDVDTGAALGIAVVGVDAANLSCLYSLDGGLAWFALGAVSQGAARLLAADADNRLYCRPNPDLAGVLPAALTVRAWDRSSGFDGVLTSTATSGGTSAFSAASDAVALTVTSVNDAPNVTVAGGGSCDLNDRSGTINLTVADVDSGAASLRLSGFSSNLVLVSNANLSFAGAGADRQLTATAAAGSTGSATLTILVSDGVATGAVAVTLRAAGSANNTQTGTHGADMLFAQNGNDTVTGLAGNDLLCGGSGNDQLSGGDGNDTISAGAGNDTSTGGTGNDTITGGAGNDTLAGEAGDDTMTGEAGNDSLTGGAGGDRFSGGPGVDTATDFTASQGDTHDGTIP